MTKLTQAQQADLADPVLAEAMEEGPTIAEATSGAIIALAGSKQFSRMGHRHPPEKRSAALAGGASVVQVVLPASITSLADDRQQHLDAVGAAFAVIANAECSRLEAHITAGEALVQAKAAGPHGTWRAWLTEHFDQSGDTAERAMNCWYHRDALREESARVRNFSLRKALAFIADLSLIHI